jgi:hypothetical protein
MEVRWLFDTAGGRKPVDPALFLATPAAYFAGSAFSGTGLDEALAHLSQHKQPTQTPLPSPSPPRASTAPWQEEACRTT